MDQEDQHFNNQGKWTTVVLAMLSSANADTGLYILLFMFIITYPLANAMLPPLKPSLAVKTFKETVKATVVRYNTYRSLLDDSVSFDITRVNELQIEALTLKEKHFQAYQRLSLTNASSWIRYANDGRKIWVAARVLQQEIDELKGKLKMAILQAKKNRVRATRATSSQDGDEVTSANSSGPPDSIV